MADKEEQLSANFKRSEFACNCGCGSDDISLTLVDLVQKIRDYIGKPITISSGIRCPKHNKQEGGVANSQHVLGTAADLHTPLKPRDLFAKVKELYSDYKIPELGYCQLYSWGVHLDCREKKANSIFNG